MTFLFLRLRLLQMAAATQNRIRPTRTATPTPILVARGHLLMLVATVVIPVVGLTDVVDAPEGFVSVGLLLPVTVAAFDEPVAAAVGACVAAAMPIWDAMVASCDLGTVWSAGSQSPPAFPVLGIMPNSPGLQQK